MPIITPTRVTFPIATAQDSPPAGASEVRAAPAPIRPVVNEVVAFSFRSTANIGDGNMTIKGTWNATRSNIEESGSFVLNEAMFEPTVELGSIKEIRVPKPWGDRTAAQLTPINGSLRVDLVKVNTAAWQKSPAMLEVTLSSGLKVLVQVKTKTLKLDYTELDRDSLKNNVAFGENRLSAARSALAQAQAQLAHPEAITTRSFDEAGLTAKLATATHAVETAQTQARTAWEKAPLVNRMLAYSSFSARSNTEAAKIAGQEAKLMRAASSALRRIDLDLEIISLGVSSEQLPAKTAERLRLTGEIASSDARVVAALTADPATTREFLMLQELYFGGGFSTSDDPNTLQSKVGEEKFAKHMLDMGRRYDEQDRAAVVERLKLVVSTGPGRIAEAEKYLAEAQQMLADLEKKPSIRTVATEV